MTQFSQSDLAMQENLQLKDRISMLQQQLSINEAYSTEMEQRIQEINRTRAYVNEQLSQLAKEYEERIKALEGKLTKMTKLNEQLVNENSNLKSELRLFEQRFLEKQKLVSTWLNNQQLPEVKYDPLVRLPSESSVSGKIQQIKSRIVDTNVADKIQTKISSRTHSITAQDKIQDTQVARIAQDRILEQPPETKVVEKAPETKITALIEQPVQKQEVSHPVEQPKTQEPQIVNKIQESQFKLPPAIPPPPKRQPQKAPTQVKPQSPDSAPVKKPRRVIKQMEFPPEPQPITPIYDMHEDKNTAPVAEDEHQAITPQAFFAAVAHSQISQIPHTDDIIDHGNQNAVFFPSSAVFNQDSFTQQADRSMSDSMNFFDSLARTPQPQVSQPPEKKSNRRGRIKVADPSAFD